jgi:exosortase/archaeosortase family protein
MPAVASIVSDALALWGIPSEVQGGLIRINHGLVGVNEACSGMRSLQTSLMIGLLFGELERFSLSRRAALVLIGIAIAFVANCARAFFLVWIAATRGIAAVNQWHNIAGYAIVGAVFLGTIICAFWLRGAKSKGQKSEVRHGESVLWRIRGSPRRIRPLVDQRSASQHSVFSFRFPIFYLAAAICWILIVEVAAEAWYHSHEKSLQRSLQWNVRWPRSAPAFRDIQIDDRTQNILHYDAGHAAAWRDTPDMNRNWTYLLYFFRWKPGHNSALLANSHRPDVCLPATGWQQTADDGVREYAVGPEVTIPFRHFEFRHGDGVSPQTDYVHAFYCVWEQRVRPSDPNSVYTQMSHQPSEWSRRERARVVLQGRRHLGQQVMELLIVNSRPASSSEAEQVFAQALTELVSISQNDSMQE